MRAVDQKRIGLAAAYNAARVFDDFQHALRHALEHLVAIAFSVAVVERAEMIDVQQDRVCGSVLMVCIQLRRVAIEKLFVVQPRQVIPLRPAQDVPVLRQLDGAADAGENDLLLGIGLGDKVDGAQGQAFDLRLAVGGHDDHGKAGKRSVLPDAAQQLQALDIRQVQIQKDQAERFVLGAHELHCLRAGIGRNDLVSLADQRF